jgi:hypothetical protein
VGGGQFGKGQIDAVGRHTEFVANEAGSRTGNTASKAYKWNGTRLVEFLPLSADGATSWASFSIDDANYLAATGAGETAAMRGQLTVYRHRESSWTELPAPSATPPR